MISATMCASVGVHSEEASCICIHTCIGAYSSNDSQRMCQRIDGIAGVVIVGKQDVCKSHMVRHALMNGDPRLKGTECAEAHAQSQVVQWMHVDCEIVEISCADFLWLAQELACHAPGPT